MSRNSEIPGEEEVYLHSEFKFKEDNMQIETCLGMINYMIVQHNIKIKEEDDTEHKSTLRIKDILRITSRILELNPTEKLRNVSKNLWIDLKKETSSYEFYLFLEEFGVKHGFCKKFTPIDIWTNPDKRVEVVASKWCSRLTVKGKQCRNYSMKGRDICYSHV